ncbi:MAG: hypothetical protein GOVbin630_99 [Prokaryotic dsDNA virus sp.]|nr:MAG: hypothetical protein GOVbin630_99 [Prokaryotic dsDNA virus sp.]|tara:strand:- start:115 stop:768 length:654 start_codon:yes stop_codon:yes gene_type:complete
MINKDTKIYGSFSREKGNTGTKIFNTCFQYYDLNALYRSFSVDNIGEAVRAARCLKFAGFAVSMPFKTEISGYMDVMSEEASKIGAINTVINKDGVLHGYNTDYFAARDLLGKFSHKKIIILGNGGYAAAVKAAASNLSLNYKLITRHNWEQLQSLNNEIIYNCTPVENIDVKKNNVFIDGITTTPTGHYLALLQASYQFKLYTGLDFPLRLNNEIF